MHTPTAGMSRVSAIGLRQVMRGHTDRVGGILHLPDRRPRCIITCSNDGSLRLWNLESGAQIGEEWRDEGDGAVAVATTMALSPRGNIVASGSGDGTVKLWEVETGKVITKWKGHAGWVQSVCWSPDGKRVVSGSRRDGIARVWDVKSRKFALGLNGIKTGHESVHAVSYSPNAKSIATGGYNESGIKIWDANTGKLLSKIEHEWPVWSLVWTSDQKKLISGTGYGSIITKSPKSRYGKRLPYHITTPGNRSIGQARYHQIKFVKILSAPNSHFPLAGHHPVEFSATRWLYLSHADLPLSRCCKAQKLV